MSLLNNTIPYQPGIKFTGIRICWIVFAMMVAPTILAISGMPERWVVFTSCVMALPGCISSPRKLGIKPLSWRDVAAVTVITLLMSLSAGIVTGLWRKFLSGCGFELQEKQMAAEVISNAAADEMLLIFVAICILTPIAEEVLFRRLIFDLIMIRGGKALAFAGTSLIFAVVHFFIPGLPGLFILGCGFQLIFLYRQNLACAMLSHAIINSLAFASHSGFFGS